VNDSDSNLDRAAAPCRGESAIAPKVAFLSNAASYPEHPAHVDVIETHFAWVFLAGERAYKLKKPTQLRGADWRTTRAREHACREELRLNRRFSASTYLAVEPLNQGPLGFSIGGEGYTVDWLVVMRRLDSRRMLNGILAAQALTHGDLDSVLQFLVGFYSSQVPLLLASEVYLNRVRSRMEESITVLTRTEFALPAAAVGPFAIQMHRAFQSVQPGLAERAGAGRLCEAHGDLRAEHVCLGPPVQMIDALEVYDELRILDAAEEIAMLALECNGPTAPWAPQYVRDRYREIAADPVSDALFDFYMALRAANRAKLAIWHLNDPEQFPDPAPWRERAVADVGVAAVHCSAAVAGQEISG
jgi:uncharacterized protein